MTPDPIQFENKTTPPPPRRRLKPEPTPLTPGQKAGINVIVILMLASQAIWLLAVWSIGGWLMMEGIPGYHTPCWWLGCALRATVMSMACKFVLEQITLQFVQPGATTQ